MSRLNPLLLSSELSWKLHCIPPSYTTCSIPSSIGGSRTFPYQTFPYQTFTYQTFPYSDISLPRRFPTSDISLPRHFPTKTFDYQDISLPRRFPTKTFPYFRRFPTKTFPYFRHFPTKTFTYQDISLPDISLPRLFPTKTFPYQDFSLPRHFLTSGISQSHFKIFFLNQISFSSSTRPMVSACNHPCRKVLVGKSLGREMSW